MAALGASRPAGTGLGALAHSRIRTHTTAPPLRASSQAASCAPALVPQGTRACWSKALATLHLVPMAAVLGVLRAGDTGVLEEGGYYRLLGRTSVDVIKQGGYKASPIFLLASFYFPSGCDWLSSGGGAAPPMWLVGAS